MSARLPATHARIATIAGIARSMAAPAECARAIIAIGIQPRSRPSFNVESLTTVPIMNLIRVLCCIAALHVTIDFSAAETPLTYTTAQAASHVGETATVCGKVAGTHHSGRGNTFVNLDGAYPKQAFTAFIPASSASVGADVRALEGKNICVTGKIVLYKGKPEIVVTTKGQIQEK